MIFAKIKKKSGAYCMHSLLKAGNLLWLTSFMPLIMKWSVAKIWDLILGHFVQKTWFLPKMKKNSDLLYTYRVKGWQPIYNYCIYATDYEMECYLNLRLDLGHFGSICPKIMIFTKNKEKTGAYCVHSLLKSDNLLRLTAYICQWSWNGVLPKSESWFWFIVWSICPKIIIFAKNEGNLGAYSLHSLL